MTHDKIESLVMWVTGKSPGGKDLYDKIGFMPKSDMTKSASDCIDERSWAQALEEERQGRDRPYARHRTGQVGYMVKE